MYLYVTMVTLSTYVTTRPDASPNNVPIRHYRLGDMQKDRFTTIN